MLNNLKTAALSAAALVVGFAATGASSAQAANSVPATPPNYHFPGSLDEGYLFDTWGGLLNPGLIVGFNPQPDPPGEPSLTVFDHTVIEIHQPSGGGAYNFVLDFPGLTGALLPAVDQPDSDGITSFTFEYGGRTFTVGLSFAGPGDAGSWTWGAFNPQPDPPGAFEFYAIGFDAPDPTVRITLQENGKSLDVAAAPEPSTWGMMLMGFVGLGLAARHASRKRYGAVLRA